ncbi:hypothetical protein T265_03835 [Opisthorchis viverrini]|uniref:Rab-GAP TBC domain-containing protein n=1 Tax=Opisthorchis viverrini TaxID=6198 RepID=A0A075A1V0_OPIVI|nr:hypothetical protein T265_03835 [Opisthorchis viverrini]KER29530.1 hypothetical protein T265_03835 [Opisthorchis viverrini]
MEEAVVRSYVHEENTTITALCAAVEAVVSHGLRQNWFSMFEDKSTLALCRRISKSCPAAQRTIDRIEYYQNAVTWPGGSKSVNQRTHGTIPRARPRTTYDFSESLMNGAIDHRPRDMTLKAIKQAQARRSVSRTSSAKSTGKMNRTGPKMKNFWIRVALLEKVLDKIIFYLATNAERFYEPYAVLSDPCDGRLLADLLRGPCAIDYSRTRTTDHLFTDPPVSELIQRHGIHGSLMSRGLSYVAPSCQTHAVQPNDFRALSTPELCARVSPALENEEDFREDLIYHEKEFVDSANVSSVPKQWNSRNHSRRSSSTSISQMTDRSPTNSVLVDLERQSSVFYASAAATPRHLVLAAKEHVESMHQSVRSTLVYGKNNVLLQTRDSIFPMRGYVSIHDYGKDLGIFLNWTPNGAISSDGHATQFGNARRTSHQLNGDISPLAPSSQQNKSNRWCRDLYWTYALRVKLTDLAYVHCHDSQENSSVVFVTKEGLQLSPLTFQHTSYLDTFLHCLEQAMGKYGFSLEPPLESDKTSLTDSRSLNIALSLSEVKAETQTNKTPKSTTPGNQPLYQGLRLAFFFTNLDSEMFLPNWSPFMTRRPSGSSEKSNENRPPTSLRQSSTTQSEIDTDYENSGVNLRVSSYKFEGRNFRKFRIACGKSKLSKIEECLGRRRDSQPIMENPDSPLDYKERHETPIEQLCDNIRREILSRAFHRWLGFCRKMRTLRSKLGNLVSPDLVTVDLPRNAQDGITPTLWTHIKDRCEPDFTFHELCRHIYFGSCDESLRREIWPYLLGVYTWGADKDELRSVRSMHRRHYISSLRQWKAAETLAKKYDANDPDGSQQVGSQQTNIPGPVRSKRWVSVCDMVTKPSMRRSSTQSLPSLRFIETCESPKNGGKRRRSTDVEPIQFPLSDQVQTGNGFTESFANSESLTTPRLNSDGNAAFQLPDYYVSDYDDEVGTPTHQDFSNDSIDASKFFPKDLDALSLNLYRIDKDVSRCDRNHSFFATPKRTFDSRPQPQQNPLEYSELNENLHKLRNIICTWVWLHLDTGYIQGMCDLLAPLLIVLEEEALTFACFSALMEWMLPNFPTSIDRSSLDSSPRNSNANGPTVDTQRKTPTKPTLLSLARGAGTVSDAPESLQKIFDSHTRPNTSPVLTTKSTVLTELSSKSASLCSVSLPVVPSPYTRALASRRLNCMDLRFSNLNSLIQVFDSKLYDYFCSKSMDTHLYFCYRWLLLDFKRELKYEDVFLVWEVIWAARRLVSYDFGIFFAMAMLQYYRDIILYYDMDLTEIIRFYNELTEQHDVRILLDIARSLVFQMQQLLGDR